MADPSMHILGISSLLIGDADLDQVAETNRTEMAKKLVWNVVFTFDLEKYCTA